MKRRDLYGRAHKALRAAMGETLAAVGRADPADECEVRDALARVEELLVLCQRHLAHENEFVHRVVEARREGASCALAEDHVEHLRAIDELKALARQRDPALYRRLALFVAENLRHMEVEESAGNALLWELFSDAEIEAIEGRIVGSMQPGQAMQMLRWMLPAMNHGERAAFFGGLAHAPAAMAEGALALARTHLRPAEMAKLEAAVAQREPATLAS